MITQEHNLHRDAKLYWKQGNSFTLVYFRAYHSMPQAPHAVIVKHWGKEMILSDFLVFTEREGFECEYRDELTALKGTYKSKRQLAIQYGWPYSRVLNVAKQAKLYGLIPSNA